MTLSSLCSYPLAICQTLSSTVSSRGKSLNALFSSCCFKENNPEDIGSINERHVTENSSYCAYLSQVIESTTNFFASCFGFYPLSETSNLLNSSPEQEQKVLNTKINKTLDSQMFQPVEENYVIYPPSEPGHLNGCFTSAISKNTRTILTPAEIHLHQISTRGTSHLEIYPDSYFSVIPLANPSNPDVVTHYVVERFSKIDPLNERINSGELITLTNNERARLILRSAQRQSIENEGTPTEVVILTARSQREDLRDAQFEIRIQRTPGNQQERCSYVIRRVNSLS